MVLEQAKRARIVEARRRLGFVLIGTVYAALIWRFGWVYADIFIWRIIWRPYESIFGGLVERRKSSEDSVVFIP